MKVSKIRYVISFLLLGLTIFVSYLFAGILGILTTQNLSFIESVTEVVLNPFSNHFNGFSPIIILIGVLIFEFIWLYKNVFSIKKESIDDLKGDESSNDNSEDVASSSAPSLNNIADSSLDIESVDLSDFGFVIPDDIKESDPVDDEKFEPVLSDESFIVSSSSDVSVETDNDEDFKKFTTDAFWALNGDYSSDQINEMVKLYKYNRDITPDLLKSTFDPSLSAEEINEYISLFYC